LELQADEYADDVCITSLVSPLEENLRMIHRDFIQVLSGLGLTLFTKKLNFVYLTEIGL